MLAVDALDGWEKALRCSGCVCSCRADEELAMPAFAVRGRLTRSTEMSSVADGILPPPENLMGIDAIIAANETTSSSRCIEDDGEEEEGAVISIAARNLHLRKGVESTVTPLDRTLSKVKTRILKLHFTMAHLEAWRKSICNRLS